MIWINVKYKKIIITASPITMTDEKETSIDSRFNDENDETMSRDKKICAMTARKRYHLSSKDLDEIPCIEVRNPYY
ncbi:MAG: hypothetical protein ABEI52_13045, partial [Halobacteriaceae archaeon]